MKQSWRFIDSGQCNAFVNMAIDEAIAISVRDKRVPPTLRFYGWKEISISIGAFQKILSLNVPYCHLNNIPIVRRPTGGRAILHGDELTYSFSSPNEGLFSANLLGTYKVLSDAFFNAFKSIGLNVQRKLSRPSGRDLTKSPLCFNSLSFGEIVIDGKKIIGSAQRRWEDGFLQQGSIPLSIDYEILRNVFFINSGDFGFKGLKEILPNLSVLILKRKIKESFEELFNVELIDSHLYPFEEEIAESLLHEKYQNFEWTENRQQHTLYSYNNGRQKTKL